MNRANAARQVSLTEHNRQGPRWKCDHACQDAARVRPGKPEVLQAVLPVRARMARP
jgi:hypothetical protein